MELVSAAESVDVQPVLRTRGAVDAAEMLLRLEGGLDREAVVIDTALDEEWAWSDEPGDVSHISVAVHLGQVLDPAEVADHVNRELLVGRQIADDVGGLDARLEGAEVGGARASPRRAPWRRCASG